MAKVASGQSYQQLKSFTGTDGNQPAGGLILAGSALYGTTIGGGSSGYGVVFKVNTDGSDYAVLKSFTGSDGWYPFADLVLASNTLYGTTADGGSSFNSNSPGYGVVFKVNTDGTGYTVLKNFTNGDGTTPWGSLVLDGSTLYGTTISGGSMGYGVIFKVNADGTGYTVLKNFLGSDGRQPAGSLILAGSTLYGTTAGGGTSNFGVVFKVNTDSSGYTVLENFTGSVWDGKGPGNVALVLADSTLYGTTQQGGSSSNGVVFKVNTDGSDYAVLKSFTGNDGWRPFVGLVKAGNTLFGVTTGGGTSSDPPNSRYGVVFKVNTDGSDYAVLKSFTGSDGNSAFGGMVLAATTLYGTTSGGGASGKGVVFSLDCLSITSPPLTQTAEIGTSIGFHVGIESLAAGATYQWFFGASDALAGATNALLDLTNVQPFQAGAYAAVVTNMGLAVTSTPALLSVIPPVDRRMVPALNLPSGTGNVLHLEYADSLAAPQWLPLSDVTLSSGSQFYFDSGQPLREQRFYRAWQTNGPRPALGVTMAAAISLTGAIGSSVRVDEINAFGPTNAWVTLDTVVLTNTKQLYYDITAFGQASRLYRLVALP